MIEIVWVLLHHELSHDPKDFIAVHLLRIGHAVERQHAVRFDVSAIILRHERRFCRRADDLRFWGLQRLSSVPVQPHAFDRDVASHDFRCRYYLPDVDGVAGAEGPETITARVAIFGSLAPYYRSSGTLREMRQGEAPWLKQQKVCS